MENLEGLLNKLSDLEDYCVFKFANKGISLDKFDFDGICMMSYKFVYSYSKAYKICRISNGNIYLLPPSQNLLGAKCQVNFDGSIKEMNFCSLDDIFYISDGIELWIKNANLILAKNKSSVDETYNKIDTILEKIQKNNEIQA